MELFPLVGVYSLHPLDRDVEQDQIDREHNLSLCCRFGPLQILLHSELDLSFLLRQLLLLDPDPVRHPADGSLCGLPILLFHQYQGGKASNRVAHVNNAYTLKFLNYYLPNNIHIINSFSQTLV